MIDRGCVVKRLAVVLLCIVCASVFVGCGPSDEAVQLTVMAAVDATENARPIDTLVPTATSTPAPIDTPEPTATLRPEPTMISKPTEDSAVVNYQASVVRILREYQAALGDFMRLNAMSADDIDIIFNEEWREGLVAALSVFLIQVDNVQALRPPPGYAGVNAALIAASVHLEEFANLYAQGVDDRDPDKFVAAAEKMGLANDSLDEFYRLMEELGDD